MNSYDDAETFAIVKRRFAERKGIIDLSQSTSVSSNTTDTVTRVITPDQLLMQYELYKEIVKLVQEREVGRGGTYDINLRDLLKLLDVLDGNAQHLRDHYEHDHHQHTATSANTIAAADDVRMLASHSFASLVYARRLQSQADQARVMAVIDKIMSLSPQLLSRLDFNKAIDTSVPGEHTCTIYIKSFLLQNDCTRLLHRFVEHTAFTHYVHLAVIVQICVQALYALAQYTLIKAHTSMMIMMDHSSNLYIRLRLFLILKHLLQQYRANVQCC
jgi:Midasin AAA lid domain